MISVARHEHAAPPRRRAGGVLAAALLHLLLACGDAAGPLGAPADPDDARDGRLARDPIVAVRIRSTYADGAPPDTLALHDSTTLAAALTTATGRTMLGKSIRWRSSDTTVVAVGVLVVGGVQYARLRGEHAGSVVVTAIADNGARDSVRLAVVGPPAPPVVEPTPVPPPVAPSPEPGTPRVGHYVSPTGSAANDGSYARPWSLAAALAHPAAVRPGDTIWVRGGTYRGSWTSTLTGTAAAPVVLRAYPGERATLDLTGKLTARGAHAIYWGLELMTSDPARVSTQTGSWPSDVPRASRWIDVYGPHLRLVNLVLHDLGNGAGVWTEATEAELYGNVVYNNGWLAPDRGHGHGIYTQNDAGTKRYVDNLLLNQYAYGFHAYGSTAARINNLHVEGNAAVGNAGGNFLIGGDAPSTGITFARNLAFADPASSVGTTLGLGPVNGTLSVTDNYLGGRLIVDKWTQLRVTGNTLYGPDTFVYLFMPPGTSPGSYAWTGNTYHQTVNAWQAFLYRTAAGAQSGWWFPDWQRGTGLDASGSGFTRGTPTGTHVVVRPNRYERGRAHVVVFNWARAGSAAADLSAVLAPGQRYEVRHAADFYAAPVASGTYAGGAVTLPLTGLTAATPIGAQTPPATDPRFAAFVVLPLP